MRNKGIKKEEGIFTTSIHLGVRFGVWGQWDHICSSFLDMGFCLICLIYSINGSVAFMETKFENGQQVEYSAHKMPSTSL